MEPAMDLPEMPSLIHPHFDEDGPPSIAPFSVGPHSVGPASVGPPSVGPVVCDGLLFLKIFNTALPPFN